MNLIFNSTKSFEKDLRKLNPAERNKLVSHVNRSGQMLLSDRTSFFKAAYRPRIVKLIGGFESSLYALKIDPHIRVLLTIDDDPIFDQIIITLIRAVRRDQLAKAFNSIAESLYQNKIANRFEGEDDVNG